MTDVGISKLLPKYIGPFRVLRRKGNVYTIELPRRMARILRSTWGVSVRTVSTSPLLAMKIVPTLKNIHQVLALALQTLKLVAHMRDHSVQTKDLSAICRRITNEGADVALDLQLRDRVLSTVRLFIFAVLSQRISQSVTPVPLVP